jgi:hypothetical protein
MSERKELSCFIEKDGWEKGQEWYEKQFERAGDAVAIGEASPNYSKYPLFPGVPGRIAKVIPEAASATSCDNRSSASALATWARCTGVAGATRSR